MTGVFPGQEPLLESRLPVPRDMVVLEDSDEEPVTDSSGDSELELDVRIQFRGGGKNLIFFYRFLRTVPRTTGRRRRKS